MTTPDDVTNFTRGDNVTLLCDVSGDVTDDVRVTWLKDGDSVVDGDRSVSEDRRLRLYDVRSTDSAEYTCEAVRRQQLAAASVTITVNGKLSIHLVKGKAAHAQMVVGGVLISLTLAVSP